MNRQTTIEKMKQMRLNGMSELYHRAVKENLFTDYTADEFIGLLTDTEWEYRENRKINNLIKKAGFKPTVSSNDIDYSSRRNLDKNMFERLLSLQFVTQAENIIITGPTGVGKSYLAQALGLVACRETIRTLYFNAGQLMEDIKLAKLEGSYIKLLKKLEKAQLLIIDDFGLHTFDNYTRQAFMCLFQLKSSPVFQLKSIPVALQG